MIDTLVKGKSSEASKSPSTSFLCDYLGISRQGYYAHVSRVMDVDVLKSSIVLYSLSLLDEMPRAGMRQLYELCCRRFGEKMSIGRDQCYALFRANGLVQRKRKRPKTTFSNHNYFIYPDLLNTTPKFNPMYFGELCVADITYVSTDNGWAYLSLVTDAASRMIVGHALHPTLSAAGPMQAIRKALDFYRSYGIDLRNLTHHSDRGSQYCCNEYVNLLQGLGVRISMTQTGDPLHNALAERMNNTIKNGWLFDCENSSFRQVDAAIEKAVRIYNTVRPHQALGMKTPQEAMEKKLPAA